MPRSAPHSSALRAPFDYLLGTRGAVAVLRALFATRVPLSQTELAKRADVHLRGLPMILEGLETAGLIGYAGRGRSRQVQLYPQHPLHQALSQLFQAEAARWSGIQQGLRGAVQGLGETIVSAWIEGPVANGTDRFSDPISVGILADARIEAGTREAFQERFNSLQFTHHIVIVAHYYQRADLKLFDVEMRAVLAHAVLLYGPAPMDLSPDFHLGSEEGRTASRALRPRDTTLIERPLQIADRIAAKLTHDPEIVLRAKEFITRRLALAGETERLSLLEWKGLLDSLTPGQIARVLREDSSRADALRQSLPFVDVLSDEEREDAFQSSGPPRKTRTPSLQSTKPTKGRRRS